MADFPRVFFPVTWYVCDYMCIYFLGMMVFFCLQICK